MTATQVKAKPAEKMLTIATWAVRTLSRYLMFAPLTTIFLPLPEHVQLLTDKQVSMKLRALLLDLQMYNVNW